MNDVVRMFKALGDHSRLRILHALAEKSYCVQDLADFLDIAQPTLSHHLKILRDAHLVIGEKEGQWTYCRINEETFRAYGLELPRIFATYGQSAPPRGVLP